MAKERLQKDNSAIAEFAARADRFNAVPLWEFFHEWFTREPTVRAVPHLWPYAELRPLLLDSQNVISAEDAERRVLALENPGLPGKHVATDSLFAGVQLIVPGEIAPSHRHTAAALRYIIEGSGAYTAVGGEKAYMQPGDFIVTPSWAWHEHGNEGTGPMVWLDVLDVPLLRFFGSGFSEKYSRAEYPERAPPGDSNYRYGKNMRPVGETPAVGASPVFSYPYSDARRVLERLRDSADLDPHHALKMEYIDPLSGGAAIPTISTYLQLVPAGTKTKPYRSTAGAIVSVVEGHGKVSVVFGNDSASFEYSPRDICAIPGWQFAQIEAGEDSILFYASDQAAQQKLGVWREQRG